MTEAVAATLERRTKDMSEVKRRPPEGGYARGDETRLRIIEAAIELFGEHGFAAASTREIAARAGVNAPALQYYFENKEGVYRACAEHIADAVWAHFEPVVRRAAEVLAHANEAAPLIAAFVAIQEALADKMFFSPTTPSQRLFFVREQTGQEPPIASDVLQKRLRQPVNSACAELVSRIGGTAIDDPVTQIRTMSLLGQLLMFHTAPRSALTMLGWTEIDAQRSELIKTTVRAQTRALLQMWSAEREARQRVDANRRG
jgi:TetR/AcrR family transcriptional regulator, regulator of cefoperazone and chloramphenicol sensitivity